MERRVETDPGSFRWIVDGHNLLFAIPDLERLQLEGARAEARAKLEDLLESFGRAVGQQIWVVFDGGGGDPVGDAVKSPHLKSIYSNPPAEADDQICNLASQRIREGEKVAVVTSDRRTLVPRLPTGARSIEAKKFAGMLRRAIRTPEKWVRSDLADVERTFLERSRFESDRRYARDLPPPGDGTAEDPQGGSER
ncbi:MAG: NYN domain-containing protein [Candidatus Eisenbacteria bacterium]